MALVAKELYGTTPVDVTLPNLQPTTTQVKTIAGNQGILKIGTPVQYAAGRWFKYDNATYTAIDGFIFELKVDTGTVAAEEVPATVMLTGRLKADAFSDVGLTTAQFNAAVTYLEASGRAKSIILESAAAR